MLQSTTGESVEHPDTGCVSVVCGGQQELGVAYILREAVVI